jgi:excisionase family DNA binding protein
VTVHTKSLPPVEQPLPLPKRLANVDRAAEYAGVHVKTIRRWVSTGRLTAYRLGPKLLRIDLNQIDDMLRPVPTVAGGDETARLTVGDPDA